MCVAGPVPALQEGGPCGPLGWVTGPPAERPPGGSPEPVVFNRTHIQEPLPVSTALTVFVWVSHLLLGGLCLFLLLFF